MGGREEPPAGASEGGSGGDDEFRPVVFDESFIRAARIQELSAQERMSAGTRPIRRRGTSGGGLPRQALALMLLVSLAFAAAVYMGSKHPYIGSTASPANLSMSVIPLQPGPAGIPTGVRPPSGTPSASATASPAGSSTASSTASAPAAPPASAASTASGSATASGSSSPSSSPSPSASDSADPGPYAGTAVEDYASGGSGIGLPLPHHTGDFSSDEVLHALKIVYNYLSASSLNPAVLDGSNTSAVKQELTPGQYKQFDDSLAHPRDDQQHDVTGWLIRFDPSQVRLVDPEGIRVRGNLSYQQLNSGTLEVTSDYTFVYALTQAPAAASPSPSVSPSAGSSSATASAPASGAAGAAASAATAAAQPPIVLFTVRRQLSYEFTVSDLNAGQVELVSSVVQAGPMSCGADTTDYLQPLFPAAATAAPGKHTPAAGVTEGPLATPGPGPSIDPFDHLRPAWDVCGVLTGPSLRH